MQALTETGFKRPTYDELLTTEVSLAKELFGEDIETGELTALGKFIRLNVYDLSALYEELESVYYARFPNTAFGASLDRLCVFAGITRNPATRAIHKIKIIGEKDKTIKAGDFIVGTLSNVTFYLLNDVTLSEEETGDRNNVEGMATALFECSESGTLGNVEVGAINIIVNPSSYVSSIEHIAVDTLGTDIETDVSLRERFSLAIEGIGNGTIDSIYGALWRVEGVTGVYIVENNSYETKDGREPISFECYVLGGDDKDIAEAIFSKAPVGVQTCSTAEGTNNVTYSVVDDAGMTHEIHFSRTKEKQIYFNITIYVNSYFDNDSGVDEIKSNIINHLADLSNGEDVIYSSIFSDIHSVEGVVSSSVRISEDGENYVSSDIVINASEVARTDTEKVNIEVSNYVDRQQNTETS